MSVYLKSIREIDFEDEVQIIEFYHQNECLWNPNHPHYHHTSSKEALITKLALQINTSG